MVDRDISPIKQVKERITKTKVNVTISKCVGYFSTNLIFNTFRFKLLCFYWSFIRVIRPFVICDEIRVPICCKAQPIRMLIVCLKESFEINSLDNWMCFMFLLTILHVDFTVEMFCTTLDQSWSNKSSQRQLLAIT